MRRFVLSWVSLVVMAIKLTEKSVDLGVVSWIPIYCNDERGAHEKGATHKI